MRALLSIALLAAACAPSAPPAPSSMPPLTPYFTLTASATIDPASRYIVAGETPLPTATPSQYTIRSGDTLSQIAENSRITLDALLQANPGIDPTALRVGSVIQIPASPADRAGEATPTPVPLPVREVGLHYEADGSAWCFILLENNTSNIVEDVTAQVTLIDPAGQPFASRLAVLPLDIIPPGGSLPLSVFFPSPVPLDLEPRVQMLTSIQLLPQQDRYLDATVADTRLELASAGRSGVVQGQVLLTEPSRGAGRIWVAAVAYDQAGQVVGWQRWENTAGVAPGSSLPFKLMIASLAGPIARVEYAVEATP